MRIQQHDISAWKKFHMKKISSTMALWKEQENDFLSNNYFDNSTKLFSDL